MTRDEAHAEAMARGLVDQTGALTQKARDTGYYTESGDPTAKAMGWAHQLGFLRTALGRSLQKPLVSQEALNFYARPTHTERAPIDPTAVAQRVARGAQGAAEGAVEGAPGVAASIMQALRNSVELARSRPGEFMGRAATVFDLGGHLANFLSAPVQTVAEAEMDTRDALKARNFSGAADAAAEAIGQAPWIAAEAIPTLKGASTLAKKAAPHIARLERAVALHDPSAVRMFIGPTAKTWDAQAAARAEAMEKAGANADDIWRETGTGRGADGKWRQEIDDSNADLTPRAREKFESGKPYYTNLSGNFEHPEVYRAYEETKPFMGDYDIMKTKKGAHGTYRDQNDSIEALATSAPEVRSITLHEMQHGVQSRENFSRGGVPEAVDGLDVLPKLNAIRAEIKATLAGRDPYAIQNRVASGYQISSDDLAALKKWKELTAKEDLVLFGKLPSKEVYKRLAGETEARNVQTRRDYTPEQRRETPPWKTEDVPRDQQIKRFDEGEAQSVDDRIARGAELRKAVAQGKRAGVRARIDGETEAPAWSLDDVEGLDDEARAVMERKMVRSGNSPVLTQRGEPRKIAAEPAPVVRQAEGAPMESEWRWARPGDTPRAEPFFDPRLSPQQNKAIELARNGFSFPDILDEMDISHNHLSEIFSRARDRGAFIPIVQGQRPSAATALADMVRMREKLRDMRGWRQVAAERLGVKEGSLGVRLSVFDKVKKTLERLATTGTRAEQIEEAAATAANVDQSVVRLVDNTLRALGQKPYLPAAAAGVAGAGAGAALAPEDAQAADGQERQSLPGWLAPVALALGGAVGYGALVRRLMRKDAERWARINANLADTTASMNRTADNYGAASAKLKAMDDAADSDWDNRAAKIERDAEAKVNATPPGNTQKRIAEIDRLARESANKASGSQDIGAEIRKISDDLDAQENPDMWDEWIRGDDGSLVPLRASTEGMPRVGQVPPMVMQQRGFDRNLEATQPDVHAATALDRFLKLTPEEQAAALRKSLGEQGVGGEIGPDMPLSTRAADGGAIMPLLSTAGVAAPIAAAAALKPTDAQAQEGLTLADGSQIMPIDPNISEGKWDRQAAHRATLTDGRNIWITPMVYKGDWIEVIRLDDHGVPGAILGQRDTLDAYAPEGRGLAPSVQPLPRNPADKATPPAPAPATPDEPSDYSTEGVMGALLGLLTARYGAGRLKALRNAPMAKGAITTLAGGAGGAAGAALSEEDDDVLKSAGAGLLMGRAADLGYAGYRQIAPRGKKLGGRIEKLVDSGSKSAKAADDAIFRGPPPLNHPKGDPVRADFERVQEKARSAKEHQDPTLWANNIRGKWSPIEAKPQKTERAWENPSPMGRVEPAQEIRKGWTLMDRLRQGMAKSGAESVKRAGERLLNKRFATEREAYLAIESEMARNARFREKVDKLYPSIALTAGAGAGAAALSQNNEAAK